MKRLRFAGFIHATFDGRPDRQAHRHPDALTLPVLLPRLDPMLGSRLFPLLLLSLAATAGAQDSAPLEQSLTGQWASTDRQFVEFRADKTFRMYPKCGREAEEWKQRGTPFLPATWEVADGNHLKLTVTLEEKSRTVDSTVMLAGDELRIVDGQGRTTVNRRYVGAWPPACPANPLR